MSCALSVINPALMSMRIITLKGSLFWQLRTRELSKRFSGRKPDEGDVPSVQELWQVHARQAPRHLPGLRCSDGRR